MILEEFVLFIRKEREYIYMNTMSRRDMTLREVFSSFTEEQKSNMAFVEMNIKNFQYYNARFGVEHGNGILDQIYSILKKFLEGKGYVERSFGDTFHFFIECPEREGMSGDSLVCNEFLVDLTDDLFYNKIESIHETIFTSFGIILGKDIKGSYDEMLIKAGLMRKICSELKKRSYSFEVFTEEKYEKYLYRQQLMERLTKARMNEEFVIYAQPKVDLHTEKIVGGEILLRWFGREDVSLAECFSVLNEYGEIYTVDLTNFKKVCRYLKEGLENGEVRVPMSFNIPNITIKDVDFKEDYLTILEEFAIPKEYVEFEFLEDLQFHVGSHVEETMRDFKEAGFRCSIDDFGAGNMSFSVLFEKNVDIVKLDRIFFKDPITEQRKDAIRGLIDVVDTFGISVLAEGVEDQEYIDFLKTTKCKWVQGYYYYKPMPLQQFQELIELQEREEKINQK